MAKYTEEIYKKGLQDPDNHNGVITHLEPDILECEVKWTLGSITTNRAKLRELVMDLSITVEVMEFQLSYFKS